MFFSATPSDERVRALLAARADAPFTHPYEGVTREPIAVSPVGFKLDVYGDVIGHGEADFASAREALVRLDNYPKSFTRVVRLEESFEVGMVFGTVASHFGFASVHPCRIVFVIDEEAPRRFGFALGTLPGHMGSGEERFLLTLDPESGSVRYDVQAISRPHGVLALPARPFLRFFQRRFQRESVAEMKARCGGAGGAIE